MSSLPSGAETNEDNRNINSNHVVREIRYLQRILVLVDVSNSS